VSAGEIPEVSVSDQEFAQIFGEATSGVLESLRGKPFTATPRPPAAAETTVAASGESLWMRFAASGRVTGEFAFQFTRSDGVRLAQLLSGEEMDGSAAFNETHADALQEIFRQFAGVAATACKPKYGGEVKLELQPGGAPDWKPSGYAAWIFAAPETSPFQWTLLLSPALRSSLAASREPQSVKAEAARPSAPPKTGAPPVPVESLAPQTPAAVDPAPAVLDPVAAGGESSRHIPANLDLLLDVELDASLRFGQREMPLREILELRPGSVIELDRSLQEPAELLVAGRVIARGEVVTVDGNYGLRITDIVQPRQRLESVET
jgi:flagellar motor switch protein FliN